MEKNIPVVFITDHEYALPTGVAIHSLVKNYHLQDLLEVFVVYTDLTQDDKMRLLECGNKNVKISLLPFDASKYKQYETDRVQVPSTSLIKFDLANIFKDYSRILYLDGDLILKSDIAGIFTYDLHGYYCLAVQDYESTIRCYSRQRLGLPFYFNSGVMLLNVEKIRQDQLMDKMLEIKSKRKDLYYMDQDVLNIVFDNKVLFAPIKYNCIVNTLETSGVHIDEINGFFQTEYHGFEALYEDAIVLHLAGDNKPWHCINGVCHQQWMNYYHSSSMRGIELINKEVPKKSNALADRKAFITKDNFLQTDYYWGSFHFLTKIRTKKGLKYYVFGKIRIK
jgi:lipopolysaccharide biosynthesis glycosyltransferase